MKKYELDSTERAIIWNTFLSLAYTSAGSLKRTQTPGWKLPYWRSNKLPSQEILKLQLLAWCILSAESRASHLIHEAVEEHDLSKTKENELRHQPLSEEWKALPSVFKQNFDVDFSKNPHKSVKSLSDLRNDLFHVNYGYLKNKLDELTSDQVLNLFVNFVDAMEDMNVQLKRGGIKNARPEVLRIADPFRH